jgi:predicted PurR-regulated permease PerM
VTIQSDLARREPGADNDVAARGLLIERSILLLLIGGLLIGVLAILKPFATPILFGIVIASSAWPIRQYLVRRGTSRGLAAMLLFSLAVALIAIPTLIIVPHLADQLNSAILRIEAYFASVPEQPSWIRTTPLIGRRLEAAWSLLVKAHGDLRTFMELYTGGLEQWIIRAAGALTDSIVQVLLSLVAAAVFWVNGDELMAALHDVLQRVGGPVADHALEITAGAIRGVVYGVIGTAFIQALLLATGLSVAGIPGAGMLGFVGLLLAISQVGGPLLVIIWGGAAWWLFRQGLDGWGIFMIAWGILVSTIDNFLKPWLIALGIQLPLSLIILGVFGGLLAFGFLGLFIGPTLIAMIYALLKAWRTVIARDSAMASAPGFGGSETCRTAK